MSLPDAWIDRIFDKLNLTYGHQFLARWDGLPVEKIKADWAHELRFFAQNPKAISYGLENLPARPPTVLEFKAVCNSPHAPTPPEPVLALGNFTKSPQELAAERHIERIKRMRQQHPEYGGALWAFALELKDREEPQWVRPYARSMYREVCADWRRTHAAGQSAVPESEPAPW
jgi:hypothetical protein